MDNTEKQATFGTQNTERRQSKENNKHNTEKKKMSNTDPTRNGVKPGACERQPVLASYKTPAMLLISG